MRRGGFALVLVVAVGLALPGGAQAEQVTANCDTPPTNRDTCNRWYTTDSVSLSWTWDPGGTAQTGTCVNGTFTADARVQRSCSVSWSNGASSSRTVWIGIDRTPPQVVGISSRPPDYNGWFNHPVDLRFQGTDATSGVASCTSTTFSGPQGAAVPATGTCRDVAGNVGTGMSIVNYDTTPPPAPAVTATPGKRRVTLSWSAPDAARIVITRNRKGAAPKVVFDGAGTQFTDKPLRDGRRYGYTVDAIDAAGNLARVTTNAVPTSSKLVSPALGAVLKSAPMLRWKPVRRARYYNVQLYRGKVKLLTRWPRATKLQLRSKWRYQGRRLRLRPGLYRWYVWPGFGRRSAHRYGKVLGQSSFRIVR